MLGIGVGISPTLMQGGGVSIPTAAQVAANLFGAGEQGLMLSEFDVFANLFQDGPGTIPVTAVGQPVGRANDLSGRGNFATFSNCTLQQDGAGRNYIAFNGTSSTGVTASINFTATAQMTVWAGVVKADDTATRLVMELSTNTATNNGSFYLSAPNAASPNNFFTMRPNGTTPSSASSIAYAAPTKSVLNGSADIAAPLTTIRVNQVQTSSAATLGTGTFGNYQVFIGARAGTSLFFSGNIYCLIVRGAATTAPMVSSTEAYVNSKTGAF